MGPTKNKPLAPARRVKRNRGRPSNWTTGIVGLLTLSLVLGTGCSTVPFGERHHEITLRSHLSKETHGWAATLESNRNGGDPPVIRLLTRKGTTRNTVVLHVHQANTRRSVNWGSPSGGGAEAIFVLPLFLVLVCMVATVNSAWAGDHWVDSDGEAFTLRDLAQRYVEEGFDVGEFSNVAPKGKGPWNTPERERK